MSERPILQKSVRKSSLASRALWGVILFVLFPFCLHTIFHYVRDYKGDLQIIRGILHTLIRDKVDLLQEIVWGEKQRLEEYSPQYSQMEKIAPPSTEQLFFTRIDPAAHILWIGKQVSSDEAVGIPVHLDEWIEKWKGLDLYDDPFFIAFVDSEEHIVAGKQPPAGEKKLFVSEPISDTGLTLEIAVPIRAIQMYEIRYYAFSFFSLLVIIGLIGGSGVMLLVRRLAKPFHALCQTMERVAEGALHVRYKPDKMGFEINTLGEQFNQMLDELLKRTEEAEKERIHRERLAQELKIGRQIQMSLLPSSLPAFAGLDIAPGYLPAQEVSGDFYDLFQIDEHRLLFVVADSAGKGISASLYGLGFRSALRALARTTSTLSKLVQQVNELFLLDTADSGFFITAWLGLYDTKNRSLSYCSQGHPPALLKRGTQVQELSTHSLAFGVESFTNPPVQEILLYPDDLLLLYTDGILEAHGASPQFFGIKRLEDFLLISPRDSSASLIVSLLSAIERFSQGAAQHDDITLLAVQISD